MAARYLGHEMLAVGPRLKTGMPIRIDNPHELGADRLVNAVAAHERLGGPCISVDFGTAVNYDVVSAEGEYLGGVIAPGVEISIDALTSRGAKLPRIDLVPPRARDRQGHRRGDPLGDHLRLRGAGRRHGHAHPRRARRLGGDDRDRRPGRAHRPLHDDDRPRRRPAHAARA